MYNNIQIREGQNGRYKKYASNNINDSHNISRSYDNHRQNEA